MDIPLRTQNHKNCCIEVANDKSHFQTIYCCNNHADFPDISPCLQPQYDYLISEMMMMAKHEEFTKSVGPIPIYMRACIEQIHKKDKLKGVEGSMVLENPIIRTPGQCPEVTIIKVVCNTMACGFKLPLNSYVNSNLDKANFNIVDLHTRKLFGAKSKDAANPSSQKIL